MSKKATQRSHQYTIRGVGRSLHGSLRRRAKDRGMSLNTLILDVLAREAGIQGERPVYSDLDALVGSWVDDPAVNAALAEARSIHPKDWE